MFKLFLIVSLLLVWQHTLFAVADSTATKQQYTAVRVAQPPKLDGVLDDAAWQQAHIATNFIQSRPNPGQKEKHKTEVKLVYDDVALYIGAVMHDVSQDSIMRQLGRRDDLGNADFFGVFLDTYNDKMNGYGFVVTPAGVQLDGRYSPNNEDFNWNAVWESKTLLNKDSWVVELKIPYSAIRFSKNTEQTWGLNFMRRRQGSGEDFFWSPIDPKQNGFLNQWGTLNGISAIQSPLRLSFMPYVSAYLQRSDQKQTTRAFNGGMDVKYGINESFTLDMTLIPDFGQVQSDNQVLNLSPFEVQYNENRQFFTEGTELFNKGNFFYSRRVGAQPIRYGEVDGQLRAGESIVKNPLESRLLNATKISGRTRKNLGIGIFNATTAETFATVRNEEGHERKITTQPLTNYNILVLDQSLKNNSYVTFINTNVMRRGTTYDANLTGGLFRLANKKNTYAVNGTGAVSQRYNVTPGGKDQIGYMYDVEAGKISGNLLYSFQHSIKSDTYNPNDLGLNFRNNEVTERARVEYMIFKPFWKLNRLYSRLDLRYGRRYRPDVFQNFNINGNINTTTKKFLTLGLFYNIEPIITYDYFEPRAAGRYYAFPKNYMTGMFVSTDSRKKLALDLELSRRKFYENNRHSLFLFIAPRYRFSDKFSTDFSFNFSKSHDDMGYPNGYNIAAHNDTIRLGLRDVSTIVNTLSGSYIFNNNMSLTLRTRHYWSKVTYKNYFLLLEDGRLAPNNYNADHNTNYNVFNVDMVYTWWFAPGSQISVVWKNAINPPSDLQWDSYFTNFSRTLRSPQNNTLSIKILYYLDYLTLVKKRRNP